MQWGDISQLLHAYPQFHQVENAELYNLLRFRNAMKVALSVFLPKRNKERAIHIAGKLEGHPREYITGTGQSDVVARRVAIYEQEGGIAREKRKSRPVTAKKTAAAKVSKASKACKGRKVGAGIYSKKLAMQAELHLQSAAEVSHPPPASSGTTRRTLRWPLGLSLPPPR